jgi:EARP and GARP complex-interacting protein 1
MFTNQSTDISLGNPCRALDAVKAERVENLWIAGTCPSVRAAAGHYQSQLQVLQFHSDVNELSVTACLDVDAPVRCIACSPSDPNLVLAAPEQGSAATLYKLPAHTNPNSSSKHMDDDDDQDSSRSLGIDTLEQVASLLPEGGFGANLVDLAWRDSSEDGGSTTANDVLTLDSNGHLTQWDLGAGATQVRSVDTADHHHHHGSGGGSGGPPPRAAWDPHANGHAVAVTTTTTGHNNSSSCCNTISILDWRMDTSVPTGTCAKIVAAHRGGGVTDLDYNPNKPYVLASAGRDGTAKFWDLRQASQPVMTARGGHSHWLSTVQYNPFHDQLVLTTGTDRVSCLWRLSTISSAPLLPDTDDFNTNYYAAGGGGSSETAAPNVQVGRRHEHGDSVYAAAWGAADAWIYMTVSFDGKAVLSHVPSKEKYKILL